jgi:hypothetical protein
MRFIYIAILAAIWLASFAQAQTIATIQPKVWTDFSSEDRRMWGEGCSMYCAVGPTVITASSSLRDRSNRFAAESAHDFELGTAWVEGAPDHGVGEYLEYTFDMREQPETQVAINAVTVVNGYNRSTKLWKANGRVKRLKMYVDGREHAILELEDTALPQRLQFAEVSLAGGRVIRFRFEIVDVYPGSRHTDTAISELEFDGVGHH